MVPQTSTEGCLRKQKTKVVPPSLPVGDLVKKGAPVVHGGVGSSLAALHLVSDPTIPLPRISTPTDAPRPDIKIKITRGNGFYYRWNFEGSGTGDIETKEKNSKDLYMNGFNECIHPLISKKKTFSVRLIDIPEIEIERFIVWFYPHRNYCIQLSYQQPNRSYIVSHDFDTMSTCEGNLNITIKVEWHDDWKQWFVRLKRLTMEGTAQVVIQTFDRENVYLGTILRPLGEEGVKFKFEYINLSPEQVTEAEKKIKQCLSIENKWMCNTA